MNTIRIATWNFHCIPVPLGCPAGHIEKVARYAQQLVLEHDIDILVLNEAFVAQARDEILASLRQVGPWNATPSDSTGPTHVGSGVVVAWRKDRLTIVGNTHKITYSNCCQFDCFSQKGGLHLKLKTRNQGRVQRGGHTHASVGNTSSLQRRETDSNRRVEKHGRAIEAQGEY